MKTVLKVSLLVIAFIFLQIYGATAQKYKPEDYGYRFMKTLYKKDTVEVVVVSKKGEELKKKPVIIIEKGSLPIPLVTLTDTAFYPIMPFRDKIFTTDYHLVYISKPGVPAKVHYSKLSRRGEYNDPKTGQFPQFYQERNHIDYYVARDAQVLKFLKKQPWVDPEKMVIAGHSEGGHIVAKLATVSKEVTHVISSSENPFGQMATIIYATRKDDDSVGTYAKEQFNYWENLVNKSSDFPLPPGYNVEQQYKYQVGFSLPAFDYFQKIKVPVLVTYGTKDHCAPYNDYMRIAMIRDKKKNFTFRDYPGLEHNYFKVNAKGEGIPDNVGWNNVANEWKAWLDKN